MKKKSEIDTINCKHLGLLSSLICNFYCLNKSKKMCFYLKWQIMLNETHGPCQIQLMGSQKCKLCVRVPGINGKSNHTQDHRKKNASYKFKKTLLLWELNIINTLIYAGSWHILLALHMFSIWAACRNFDVQWRDFGCWKG